MESVVRTEPLDPDCFNLCDNKVDLRAVFEAIDRHLAPFKLEIAVAETGDDLAFTIEPRQPNNYFRSDVGDLVRVEDPAAKPWK
jgi:hypothetical protein